MEAYGVRRNSAVRKGDSECIKKADVNIPVFNVASSASSQVTRR